MYANVWFCGLDNRKGKKTAIDKTYTYKIPTKMKIKKGDFALVYVQRQNRLEIVQVVETSKLNKSTVSDNDIICLISKLDFKPLDDYVEVKKRKEILEKAIDTAYKKASKMQILEQIAKTDKDLQKLLEEYKTLGD